MSSLSHSIRVARSLRWAASLLTIALLLGCQMPRSGYGAEQETVDGLTITLERPEAPLLLEDYDLVVALADEAGRPVDGASVYLNLAMPAMPMGVNQPVADPLGGGRYQVRGAVFTMEGDWVIFVHATVAGKEHVATFESRVAPS